MSKKTDQRDPILSSSREPDPLPTPSPNEHVQTLIELLRPPGADLARRWLSALFLVPVDERAKLVEEVERQIVETYDPAAAPDDETLLHVRDEPVEKDGYTEQTIRSYAPTADEKKKSPPRRKKA